MDIINSKEEVLDFVRKNPGCTLSSISDEVFGKWRWSGWILARNNIEMLCAEGLVDERFSVVSLRFIRLRKKRPPDFQTAFLLKVND